MKRIRQRLSYANVMSTLAVFLVLGGASAFAASQLGKNSVGPRQLKRNAVTAAKIKRAAVTAAKIRRGAVTAAKIGPDSITGAKVRPGSLDASDIDLSTLPRAVAQSVTRVGSADNADTVSGQSVQKLYTTLPEGASNVPVATVAGFTISASCNPDDADVTVAGPTAEGFVIQAGGVWTGEANRTTGGYEASKAGEGGAVRLDWFTGAGGGNANFGLSMVAAATTAGTTLSGTVGYDFDTFDGTSPDTCLVYGQLTAG